MLLIFGLEKRKELTLKILSIDETASKRVGNVVGLKRKSGRRKLHLPHPFHVRGYVNPDRILDFPHSANRVGDALASAECRTDFLATGFVGLDGWPWENTRDGSDRNKTATPSKRIITLRSSFFTPFRIILTVPDTVAATGLDWLIRSESWFFQFIDYEVHVGDADLGFRKMPV
jgi:hypothetical protein